MPGDGKPMNNCAVFEQYGHERLSNSPDELSKTIFLSEKFRG